MHDEYHAAFQHARVAVDDVARPVRGDAEAVAAHPHIGRPAIIAVAGFCDDAVDGTRHIGDGGTGAAGVQTFAMASFRMANFSPITGRGAPSTVVRQICANWPR